jgi:hypothetical protein
MFEITKGRFVDASKIIGANIYRKDTGQISEENGERITEVRVAIDLDTSNKDKASVYAGPFPTETDALMFIKSIPLNKN